MMTRVSSTDNVSAQINKVYVYEAYYFGQRRKHQMSNPLHLVRKRLGTLLVGLLLLLQATCVAMESTEPSFSTEAYEVLLANPIISTAMVWDENRESRFFSYDAWSDKQKGQLFQAIARIESGDPFPLQNPPDLTDSGIISNEDAWTVYLTHVAHTLWLEANHVVNWSILDYTPDELALLLDSRTLLLGGVQGGYFFHSIAMGNVTDWNIDLSYQFMQENGFIRDTPLSTLYAFAGWASQNLAHYIYKSVKETQAEAYDRIWRYAGPPPVDRILYPIVNIKGLGYSNIAGCWGVTGLFSAVMRSVNIPTVNHSFNPQRPGDRKENHSTPVFPTLGIGLVHGDDIYGASRNILGAGWWGERILCEDEIIPLERTFHTIEWLDANVFQPAKLDTSDRHRNTPEEQAGFNAIKYNLDLKFQNIDELLLWYRAQGASQKSEAAGMLENYGAYSSFAMDFYTDEEFAHLVGKLDEALIRIGQGDWAKGAAFLRKSGKPIILDLASSSASEQLFLNLTADALSQPIRWRSSNESVATVSNAGVLTGLKKGTTTITASAPLGLRREASRIVVVTWYARDVLISGSAVLAGGKKTTVKAEVLPKESVGQKVTWASSDPAVAKVSSSGVVTAVKTDTVKNVTITATARDGSGAVGEYALAIYPAAKRVTLLRGSDEITSVTVAMRLSTDGSALQLSAAVSPADAYSEVVWKSSNPSVALISQDGMVTCLKKGTATITATAVDGTSVKAACKVKVEP